ncbi:sigma factor-like helix-turn-helix DNA-binding protein [Corynebacterium sp. UMB10321]|uniref:sigma factor-like helix-turn-helix DNA-binding protein n=1 Tax=Corynebacterium sp. UMB10321 TaxID=3046312 RepID=UPI002551659F|nr:sigma factor-like helix-turn-helix DNA-binding protein [Corynebacterium sp. UMB10321]MDK8243468.1 sigma factor-like helix-turn-helix DNA-binding protein [Corynebacterium sp. UMB10321]
MKVTFRHEADNNKHESVIDVYDIASGEFAVMVEADQRERAAQLGRPVDEVEPRHPQQILDDLARKEEAVFHEAYRGDRGPGSRTCTCGAGCGPRRGCRVPRNAPWSLDWFLEIDRDPADPTASPEDRLIATENTAQKARESQALREAIAGLEGKARQVMEMMLADTDMKQSDVARALGLSRARVSQLFKEAAAVIRQAVEATRFNTSDGVGSGVKGAATRATPTNMEGR